MAVSQGDVLDIANQLLILRGAEQARLRRISRYMRGKHEPPYMPRGASTEYRWLARRGKENFLPLIVSSIAQNLHVDGYRPTGQELAEDFDTTDPDPMWQAFRANRMLSRQHGVHRAVIKYGAAYIVVLPGSMNTGASTPIMRPVSPRRMTAVYADDVDDEWPVFAVEERTMTSESAPNKRVTVVSVYDDTFRYVLITTPTSNRVDFMDDTSPFMPEGQTAVMEHNMGVCPVVRFVHEQDLDGEMDVSGEVEPLIDIQDQINFATFNLMLSEQFGAYRQRWVTGMAPVDESGRDRAPFRPGVDRVWASEDSDTRFGEFDATDLTPYVSVRDSSIQHMSTISQVPPYMLLGQLVNLSADALAAARNGFDQKIDELKANLTDPWRNTFRLSGKAVSDDDIWEDLTGTVVWRDTSARSFAATIDALGKAAQMLGVPVTELWRRIPGVTEDEVQRWQQVATQASALAELNKILETSNTLGVQSEIPTTAQPFQQPLGAGQLPKPAPAAPASAAPAPGANGAAGAAPLPAVQPGKTA